MTGGVFTWSESVCTRVPSSDRESGWVDVPELLCYICIHCKNSLKFQVMTSVIKSYHKCVVPHDNHPKFITYDRQVGWTHGRTTLRPNEHERILINKFYIDAHKMRFGDRYRA